MPLDGKSFDLEVFEFPNFQTGGHVKSKLLASSQPDRWPQDVKTFEFVVFGRPNVEFKVSNILGPCPRMLKFSIWMQSAGNKKILG